MVFVLVVRVVVVLDVLPARTGGNTDKKSKRAKLVNPCNCSASLERSRRLRVATAMVLGTVETRVASDSPFNADVERTSQHQQLATIRLSQQGGDFQVPTLNDQRILTFASSSRWY